MCAVVSCSPWCMLVLLSEHASLSICRELETLQPNDPQQQVGSLDCGYHMLARMEHHLSDTAAAASNDSGRFLAEFTAKDVMQLRAYVKHAIYLGARPKK